MKCAAVLMVVSAILSPSLTTPSAARDGKCELSTEERLKVMRQIRTIPECGPGVWLQIADFDISGPSQCPPEWEFSDMPLGQEGCRRPDPDGGCTVAAFSTGGFEYGKVRGRIIGAAAGNPDAFRLASTLEAIQKQMARGLSMALQLLTHHQYSRCLEYRFHPSCLPL